MLPTLTATFASVSRASYSPRTHERDTSSISTGMSSSSSNCASSTNWTSNESGMRSHHRVLIGLLRRQRLQPRKPTGADARIRDPDETAGPSKIDGDILRLSFVESD